MPSNAKLESLQKITEDLGNSDFIWVVDYRGLTVKEAESLRANIRETGASLKVNKNSLTELALASLNLPSLGSVLEGPSAFVFAAGDPVASAKVLKTFAKANPKLEIKGGLLNGAVVTVAQIESLADLPSREVLLGMLMATMNNPMTSLVRVLNGPATGLARAIQAIADKAA